MAEDSNGKTTQNQEIDLDNIEVELVIICKNQNGMNSAGSFLTRRGWPTTVVSEVGRGVEVVADKKPDFVLISLSHPSNSINKLPDLITQTFNIPCIGFIESTDSQSTAKLTQAKLRHKISGQPSGPNIHRTIRKILAEKFNIAAAGEERSITPGGTAAGGGVMIQKSSDSLMQGKKDKESPSSQLIKGGGSNAERKDGPTSLFSKKGNQDTEDAESTSGRSGRKSNIAYMGGASSGAEGDDDGKGGGASDRKKSNIAYMGGAGSDGTGASGTQDGNGSGMAYRGSMGSGGGPGGTNSVSGDASGGSGSAGPETGSFGSDGEASSGVDVENLSAALVQKQKPRKRLKQLEGVKEADTSGNLLFGETIEKGTSVQAATTETMPTADLIAEMKKSLFGEGGEDITAAINANKSPLERAVETTMSRICQTMPDFDPARLEEISSVGVFPVESATQPGYLVMVWQAPDQSARDEFLRNCEVELQNAFATMNVTGKLESGFWVDLPPVQFAEWANNGANFTFVLAHQKREVGIAFFKKEGPLPKPTPPTATNGMYSVKVDDISTEFPVNFKAFIHFVNNNRFFLYLRNGRKLAPEQKQRLQQRKMNDFYMKSVDLENVRQYMAMTYLGGLVIDYKKAFALSKKSGS